MPYPRITQLFLLLHLLGWSLIGYGRSAPVFSIDTIQTVYSLTEQLEILSDQSSALSFEEVQQAAEAGRFQSYSAFLERSSLQRKSTYWCRIEIQNNLPGFSMRDYFLYLGWADSIEVYIPESAGQYTVQRAGVMYAASQRDVDFAVHQQRVHFSLDPFSSKELFIRYREARSYPLRIDLELRRPKAKVSWGKQVEKLQEGLFFGFLLTMFLFNMIMFIATKDRVFIYHGLYLFGTAFYMLDVHYLLHNMGPFKEYPFIKNMLNYLAVNLMDVAYLMFVRQYAHLKERLPVWNRIFTALIWLRVFLFLLVVLYNTFTLNEGLIDPAIALYFLIEYNLILPFFLYALYKQHSREGNYLIIGTLILLVDIDLVAFLTFKEIQVLYWKYPVYLGFIGEISMFTMGLGWRMRRLRTQREEAVRQQELNSLKSRFYTNITHDFRTPITVILGLADQLRTRAVDLKRERQILATIQNNSLHLLNLVNQMLDLARLESNTVKADYRRGDVVGFLRYLADSFHSLATGKDISLSLRSRLEELEMDYDREKLQQIVANLLGNAIKFTPPGGKVSLLVEQISSKLGDERLILRVKDTGIGIPKEKLPYIFDRFYQVEDSSQVEPGTGIGLSLVQELVELLNGKIDVHSVYGKGTEFVITLPVTRQAPRMSDAQLPLDPASAFVASSLVQAEEETTPFSENPYTILVVEDNPDVVQYIRFCIENQYTVEVAYNGQRGWEKALEIIPDLIISDVMMPEMDGFELCEHLRDDMRTSHIPIILLTAKASAEDRLAGLKKGADAYLTKPFIQEELLLRIRNLLTQQEKLKEYYQGFLQEGKTEPEIEDPEKAMLLRVVETIRENISNEAFNAEALAQALLMSRTQLYRKLESLTDEKPAQLIRQVRLQKAKEMLEQTTLTVSEIGMAVGYSEPSNFTKVFKDYYEGITPSEVRRLLNVARKSKQPDRSLESLAAEAGYENSEALKAAFKKWFGLEL